MNYCHFYRLEDCARRSNPRGFFVGKGAQMLWWHRVRFKLALWQFNRFCRQQRSRLEWLQHGRIKFWES
jgi:hypothetical protein